ncbi:hypothetical protein P7G70_13235, partial [Enterococcus dispar]
IIGNPSLNHRYRKGFYSLFKTLQQNPVNESQQNDHDQKKEAPRKKEKSSTTTIRCATNTSHRLNALITSFNLDSVNELLEILLDNYEASLTPDERREIKTLLEVYQRKSRK